MISYPRQEGGRRVDFSLSEEQRMFQATLREFLQREVPSSYVREIDRKEEFPWQLWEKFADFGLLGVGMPEEYGGNGGGLVELAIVLEELAYAGASLVYAYAPTIGFCRQAILGFGTEEQKREYLPRIAAGKLRFAMGLSEPNHGSDLATLETTARLEGDTYIVNGSKIFTTGADTSDYILTVVRTDLNAKPAHKGLSVLIIPTNSPGITIRKLDKLAGQAVHTCEVFFDDVRVPRSQLLHEENKGWYVIMRHLDEERMLMSAQCIGTARGAYEYALKYAKEREQFGQPIGKFQVIGHMLADMATGVELCRLITYYAIWRKENGLPCSKEASMARVFASETAMKIATQAMQILGGYSYMMEYEAQRYFREAKLWEIAGGTNQIQRNIIAKEIGL